MKNAARVLDLQEYRRRRAEEKVPVPAEPVVMPAAPVAWVPVWLWVPVVLVR